jgi:starch synthase
MYDRPLKILMVSSEVVPFAKTGGLADVAGSLPKALALVGNDHSGNDIRVVMPRYRQIENATYKLDFPIYFNNRFETTIIRENSSRLITATPKSLGEYTISFTFFSG